MLSLTGEAAGLCRVTQVPAADTRAIEAGLNELWRRAESGEVGGALGRAASMTLIMPVDDAAAADEATPLLESLTATHPLRAILVQSDERIEEPRARLCSHIRRAGEGEAGRYWEEIRLVSSKDALGQVMSAVAMLALPNLPVVTWWPGDWPPDADLYDHIISVSDRLIVDSTRFADPARSLVHLAEAIDLAHETVAFADLSWTRLTPWRILTAEFFDPPSDQELLDSIQRVSIQYVPLTGGEASQALLFLGWLASRLGWEPNKLAAGGPGRWRFQVIDGVRPVQVEIEPVRRSSRREATPGLRSVRIEAAEGERCAAYTIDRWGDGE